MSFSPHNQPRESIELQILTHLHPRMTLSNENQQHHINLQKGYIGELKFYNFLQDHIAAECLQLYGLLLESNHSLFQIDTLLFFQNMVYLFEVKNFEGDVYIQDDRWFTVSSRKEIRNPAHQLKRSKLLLRQLLQKFDFPIKINSFVVFVNPEFTLYQAPLSLPIILPTQLKRLAKKLNAFKAAGTTRHTELAKQLISSQADPAPYMNLPDYHFNELKKGIRCCRCSRFLSYLNYKKLGCQHCGCEEDIESAVICSVK